MYVYMYVYIYIYTYIYDPREAAWILPRAPALAAAAAPRAGVRRAAVLGDSRVYYIILYYSIQV